MQVPSRLLGGMLLFLLPGLALAQEDSLARVLELGELVITAQHSPIRAQQSVHQIRVLDRSRIEAQAAQTLPDLLQAELGIQLTQDPVLGTQVRLQGLSGQHVKVLIDGVPVTGRQDGELDLSQLPLHQIERIEVVEGPLSVEYGTNALAGTINLITKKEAAQGWEGRLALYEANVGPGWSVYEGIHNLDAGLFWRKNKHQIGLNGGRYFFGGSFAEKDDRAKGWKPKRQHFLSGNYQWHGSRGHLSWQSGAFDELLLIRGEPGGLYAVRAQDEEIRSLRQQHQLSGGWTFNERQSWQGVAAWSGFDRRRNGFVVDLSSLERQPGSLATLERFSDWTARGSFQQKLSGDRLHLDLGYDLLRAGLTGDKVENNEQWQHDLAGFVVAEYRPGERWAFRPGLRAAYNDKYPAPLTPSFHLRFAPSRAWTLRGSYARGFRAPSLKERFLDFVDVNHNITGNADLLAERGHYGQVSAQWQSVTSRRLLRAGAELFYNHIRDRIELGLLPGSDNAFTYFNLSELRVAGLQLGATWRQEKLLIQAGANLLGQDALSQGWLWSVQGNVLGQLQLPAGWQASLFYKYQGPAQIVRQAAESGETALLVSRLAGYHWADATLQKHCFDSRLLLALGVKNLLNVTNVNASGGTGGAHSGGSGSAAIALGRSAFFRMQISF